MLDQERLIQLNSRRVDNLKVIVFFFLGVILSRLVYLQIIRGHFYHNVSLKNRLKKEDDFSTRGQIFDRNNILLVTNQARYDLVIIPERLEREEQTLFLLANLIESKKEKLSQDLYKFRGQAKYIPILIRKDLKEETIARVEAHLTDLPGVEIKTFHARKYPQGYDSSHILGYLFELNSTRLERYKKRGRINYVLGDLVGQSGLEKQWNDSLKGVNGYRFYQVDARGKRREYVESKVAEAMEGKDGGVAIIDVNNGEVLSLFSNPGFNPEELSNNLSVDYWNYLNNPERKPLINKAYQEHYQPGSTFKPITGLTLLKNKKINKRTHVSCNGKIKLGRRTFHCWKKNGHGKTDLKKAIRESCNVFFQQNSVNLDIDELSRTARMFGFGARSGIKLEREVTGLVPTREWKKKNIGRSWKRGETLHCSIGHSYLLVSALQLASSYGAIATEGRLYKPILTKEVYDNDGGLLYRSKPELIREIDFNKKDWSQIKNGLREVTGHPEGTAFRYVDQDLRMAGKSGTAQVKSFSSIKLYEKCEEKKLKDRHHSWFVAYAPYDNPKIAISVITEHGCSGSAVAKIVSKVLKSYKELHPGAWL